MGKKDKVQEQVKEQPQIISNPWKLAGIGDLEGLKKLLEVEGESKDNEGGVDLVDTYRCTPFIWAARNGKMVTATYLLDQGADLEFASFGGMRAIHHAVNNIRSDMIAELIQRGCDINAADDAGNTTVHWAAEKGVLSQLERILDAGGNVSIANVAKATPVHKASNEGHASCVQCLINKGADVNALDKNGNTALVSTRNELLAKNRSVVYHPL